MKLDGRSAVVVGTSANIGAGIALALAGEGARVACLDRDPRNARDCAADIERSGGRSMGLECDASNEDQIRTSFRKVADAQGGIDIVVNGAAFFNQKGILEMPLHEWKAQIDVILGGAFLGTKYGVAHMLRQGRGGSIINLASTEAHQGSPGNIAYTTSKAGILNFSCAVAMEVARFGIRVNSLTPTATDPSEGFDRAERWGRDVSGSRAVLDLMGGIARKVPMRRLPGPRHYGAAAVYLCSDEAEYVTGFDLRVDAGNIARYWRWDPNAESTDVPEHLLGFLDADAVEV
jgi:NAD(P)-dependent dehydrogenase (short-subunit alcohol dehydrogenase family)